MTIKINLWYSEHNNQWRWTLCDDHSNPYKMESGQQHDLRIAMNDVANTVEYILDTKYESVIK